MTQGTWRSKAFTIATISVLITLLLQLYLCRFFSFGALIPISIDNNIGNFRDLAFHFPPHGFFSTDYWLGFPKDPAPLTPLNLLANLPAWWFFTTFYPLCGALSLLTFYWFLRLLGFQTALAMVGGVIYAWQGDLLGNIFPGHFAPAVQWALFPFAFGCAVQTIRERDWFYAAVSGAACGLMVTLLPDRGGLSCLLIGIYILTQAFKRSPKFRFDTGAVLRFCCIALTAFLVSLPALHSNFHQYVQNAEPGHHEDTRERYHWATQWSQPPEEWLAYWIPGFFGWYSGSSEGPYWGRMGRSARWEQEHSDFRNFSMEQPGFGTAAFILASIGLIVVWRKRKENAGMDFTEEQQHWSRFFAAAAILCWFLSLGRYLPHFAYQWVLKIPGMYTWRNPVKWMVPGGFCVMVLAVFGLRSIAALIEHPDDDAIARLKIYLRCMLYLLACFFIVSGVGEVFLSIPLTHEKYSPKEIIAAAKTAQHAIFFAGLEALFFLSLISILHRPESVRRLTIINPLFRRWRDRAFAPENLSTTLCCSVAFAVVAQMFWVQMHYLQPYDLRHTLASNPLMERLKAAAPARVKVFSQDGPSHEFLTFDLPFHKISSVDIPAISRMPRDYQAFFDAFHNQGWRLWQLAGVRYVLAPGDLLANLANDASIKPHITDIYPMTIMGCRPDDFRISFVDGSQGMTHALVELRNTLDKATLIPALEILPTSSDVLKQLDNSQWDPVKTILVDAPTAKSNSLSVSTPAMPLAGKSHVNLIAYTDSEIRFRVKTPSPCYLLINDRFDSGWHALINGHATAIFPANFILRAVRVPAGESDVRMIYDVSTGFVWFQLSLLAILSLWAIVRVLKRDIFPLQGSPHG